jgi:hypothetical protein
MTTLSGPTVDIGTHAIRLPSGWSVTQTGKVVMCSVHDLKQRVALFDAAEQPFDEIPIEGQRTAFNGRLFSGHLEEGVIPPPWFERILFRRKSHYRFEWVLQSGVIHLAAVYLAELEEDRPRIKTRIEELLDALEIA